MRNQRFATARRLSDPDFQGQVVHTSLLLNIALSAVVVAFVFHDTWVWSHPAPPRYFAIDGKHMPRQIAALDSPIVGDTELLEWAVKAIVAPYNINWSDYPAQLSAASRRFTPQGWNTFAQSFINTGNFEKIKSARLLCRAQFTRAATINQANLNHGALAYRIEVPIEQVCENTNGKIDSKLLITALVVRTNDVDHPDGLVIDQLVAKPNN